MKKETLIRADCFPLSAQSIPNSILSVLERFDRAEYEAYCVGGCVRDLLRGVAPHDWDLCTAASPDEVLALFSDVPCLTVGLKHGTVTVLWDGSPVEITTYRCEGDYLCHRSPSSVTFTRSLREDCVRRDFTVNAIAYHPGRGLRDFFGGQADLQNGVLRCVGDAHTRLTEDALRILRALRFSSVLGFSIHPDTDRAIKECAPTLVHISGERIVAELKKLLAGENAAAVLSDYADVIAVFFPPLSACGNPTGKSALQHAFSLCKAPQARLSACLCISGICASDTARHTLSALPFDNAFTDAVCALTEEAAAPPPTSMPAVRRALKRMSASTFEAGLLLHCALFPADADSAAHAHALCRTAIEDGLATRISHLAINGRDLSALGLRGKEIGRTLDQLLDAVIDGEIENTRQALLKRASRQ